MKYTVHIANNVLVWIFAPFAIGTILLQIYGRQSLHAVSTLLSGLGA